MEKLLRNKDKYQKFFGYTLNSTGSSDQDKSLPISFLIVPLGSFENSGCLNFCTDGSNSMTFRKFEKSQIIKW